MELSIPQIEAMNRLLDEALTLDPARRLVWLERLSPEYQDLAPALRRALLSGEMPASGPNALVTLAKFASPHGANEVAGSDLQPGTRVGPYELTRPLGAGGMAEVWLARRADGAFKREVALKIPRLPMLTQLRGDLELRFALERDILARLEHPQIARFYDAGVDANGLPYLAMEYVHGEPLGHWCLARELPISARLELLVQVLAAVQYAHEKNVIHRDLKPSNILVTESGQVRLLDFGVAKLLEAQEAENAPMTGVYARALTPDYASPELLRGDPVDPRTDVYSLGVVLYELLTGARPCRLKSGASLGLIGRATDAVEVRKPSAQIAPEAIAGCPTAPEKLVHPLRGDLDAIALKALAKQPYERYPSAAALAEDLRRYLEGKPLLHARPARLLDRLGKFVRRNQIMVGISATAVAAVVAAVGYALYREDVYQVSRVKAMANAVAGLPVAIPDKSIAVLPFVDMSEKRDQEYFAEGLSEQLIDLLTKVPDLRVPARTSSFYFKGRHVAVAEIAKALNVAHVLEGSVRRDGNTVRVTAQLIRADNGYHLWSETYDRKIDDIFKIQDSIANAVVNDLKVSLVAKGAAPNAASNGEAYLLYVKGRYLNDYLVRNTGARVAIESLQRSLELNPSYAPAWYELANAYVGIALDAEPGEHEQYMGRAREALTKAIALNYADAGAHYLLAAILLSFDHDWPRARAEVQAAQAIDPTLTEQPDLATARGCCAGPCYDTLIRNMSRDIERDPLSAGALADRGDTYYCHGDLEAAERDQRQAIALSPGHVSVRNRLAKALIVDNKLDEAALVLATTAESLEKTRNLAILYFYQGKRPQADAALADLIAKYSGGGSYDIAEVYAVRGNNQAAINWLERDYDNRMWGIMDANGDPLLKNLAHDPRYIAFLHKIVPTEASNSGVAYFSYKK